MHAHFSNVSAPSTRNKSLIRNRWKKQNNLSGVYLQVLISNVTFLTLVNDFAWRSTHLVLQDGFEKKVAKIYFLKPQALVTMDIKKLLTKTMHQASSMHSMTQIQYNSKLKHSCPVKLLQQTINNKF